MKNLTLTLLFIMSLCCFLSGCMVVSAAVDVTTTVVGGAIDVVDAITPDIIDDDEDDDEDDENENNKNDNPQ